MVIINRPPGRTAPRRVRERVEFHLKELIVRFCRDQSGATAIEYGLIAGLVSVVIISALKTTGTKMSADFSKVAANLG